MTFEGFTAGEEIGWGEESTVYAALPAGGASATPLALKLRGFQAESESAALLEAAREQQRAAAAGCISIAPVLAAGIERHSFYIVLPRYPRTVFSLIQGKVAVRPEGMEALARQVLAALRQLRERQGRAHGNIKGTNILLTGTGRLRDSEVFLADFAVEKTQDSARDVQALGRTLYQLVRRREVQNFDWPLADSTHWTTMGPRGQAARTFCNALLDPALAASPDPLGTAEQALGRMSPRGGAGVPWLPIALAALVLVLAGGAWRFGPGWLKSFPSGVRASSTPIDGDSGASWVERVAAELPKDPQGAGGDNYLETKILAPVRDGRPEEARAAFAAWDAPRVVNEGYTDLASRGWTVPAGSISRLRGTLSLSQPALPQLRAISHAAALVPQVQLQSRLLGEKLEGLKNSGDPVLAQAPPALEQEAASAPDLDRLLRVLTGEGEQVERLLAVHAAADHARLEAEGKFAHFSGSVDAAVLRDWEGEARRFTPDPAMGERLRAQWTKALGEFPPGGTERLAAEKLVAEAEGSLAGALPVDEARIEKSLDEKLGRLRQPLAAMTPAPLRPLATPPPASAPPSPPPSRGAVPELPEMASDRKTFDGLLQKLKETDLAGKGGGAMRAVRDDFVHQVEQRTSPVYQQEIGGFLKTLKALPFHEDVSAPALPAGWQKPVSTPTGVVYTWGKYRLDFVLIPGESPCYLAAQEFPIGLLIDWMNEHGNWAEIGLRASSIVRGPRGWQPSGPGIAVRREWTWPTILPEGMTFYPLPAKAPPPEPPSAMMPLNYISGRSAQKIAAQFGCRLPTPAEWKRALELAKERGWLSDEPNLRDARWERQRAHVASLVAAAAARFSFRDPPWPDGDIFVPSGQSVAHEKDARAAKATDDHALWFHAVNATSQPFADLIGNVAEFVADGEGDAAHLAVIGGSALSAPELDVATAYPVGPQRNSAFSDVGLRLALPAGGAQGPERDREEEAFKRALLQAPAASP